LDQDFRPFGPGLTWPDEHRRLVGFHGHGRGPGGDTSGVSIGQEDSHEGAWWIVDDRCIGMKFGVAILRLLVLT